MNLAKVRTFETFPCNGAKKIHWRSDGFCMEWHARNRRRRVDAVDGCGFFLILRSLLIFFHRFGINLFTLCFWCLLSHTACRIILLNCQYEGHETSSLDKPFASSGFDKSKGVLEVEACWRVNCFDSVWQQTHLLHPLAANRVWNTERG